MQKTPPSDSLLRNRNLHIIFLITLMGVLGVSSITPAFPKIALHFDIPAQSVGLLIISFTLPGVFLTPVLGVLADRYGRKIILVPSLLLFGIAGGLCALTRDFTLLLVFRFIQGSGAAALGSLNVTIIGDLFAGRERTTAMGYNASVLSIATASYPFIGGVLATIGWYFPFFLPFLAIPVGLLVLWQLKIPTAARTQTIGDYLKSAFASLKNKKAILYFTASLVVFIILYGSYLTYIPILLHDKFDASPFQIGLVMACMSVMTAITSSQAGRLTRRFREITLLRFSFIFYAVSLALVPFIQNIWFIILPIAFYGIGQGINMPNLLSLLTGLAPIEYRAAFMSMNGMVLRIGQTLGPLVMGFVFVVGGVSMTFWAGAFLALIMFGVFSKVRSTSKA